MAGHLGEGPCLAYKLKTKALPVSLSSVSKQKEECGTSQWCGWVGNSWKDHSVCLLVNNNNEDLLGVTPWLVSYDFPCPSPCVLLGMAMPAYLTRKRGQHTHTDATAGLFVRFLQDSISLSIINYGA